MSTNTTDCPNQINNRCAWRTQTAISVVAAGLLLLVVAPAPAQTGPILNEVVKLLATDGTQGDQFGDRVAIYGDTAVIGAHFDDDIAASAGSAYVFTRAAAGVWTQQAKLLASDGAAKDFFGSSVAISGGTAVVGAEGDDDKGTSSGSVYIFVRDAGGVWTQQAKLLASDGAANDFFGSSVAISGDTVVAGVKLDDEACPLNPSCNSGSAYVFVRDAAGVWTQQTKLLASDAMQADRFGASVALTGDTAVIGAPLNDDNGISSGSAYVFVRDTGGLWTEQVKLLPLDGGAGDDFGQSVAVSGDTVVVGAFLGLNNTTFTRTGTAYAFARNPINGTWAQQAKFLASDAAVDDQFGLSIGVSGDIAVVGANGHDDNGLSSGSAYAFVRDAGGVWTEQAELLASDGVGADLFGLSVGVSGSTAIAGARFTADVNNGVNSGSAYIFELPQGASADLNSDGVVDAADLATLLAQWGCLAPANCPADFNGDGTVDSTDLAFLLANWG